MGFMGLDKPALASSTILAVGHTGAAFTILPARLSMDWPGRFVPQVPRNRRE